MVVSSFHREELAASMEQASGALETISTIFPSWLSILCFISQLIAGAPASKPKRNFDSKYISLAFFSSCAMMTLLLSTAARGPRDGGAFSKTKSIPCSHAATSASALHKSPASS
jgi:hypothetical protein